MPLSTARFLLHSGLEWARVGCYDRDVTASGMTWPDFAGTLPKLVPRRLGHAPVYRARAFNEECKIKGEVYESTAPTGPLDRANRPPGLEIGEGFALDLDVNRMNGRGRRAADGSLAGVPAYYARITETVAGTPGIRVIYWLLFGAEARGPLLREGDWERVDVVARQGRRRNVYEPAFIELQSRSPVERIPWSDMTVTGRRDTHPVVLLSRGRHTPEADGECEECVPWRTWRLMKDVRDEPWWGYGGGWGANAADRTVSGSGPSGPAPTDLSARPPGR